MNRHTLLLLVPSALIACGLAGGQHREPDQEPNLPIAEGTAPAATAVLREGAIGKKVVGDGQLTEYVRRIFQDSKGRYWFGSNGDGVYRYDPGSSSLEVFSTEEGLAGTQVTGILEDSKGHMWISTSGGVSRYDENSFTNYTTKDGLPSNGCWSIFEARDGTIWVGTSSGVCRRRPGVGPGDGPVTDASERGRFELFALKLGTGQTTDDPGYWTSCITQDRSGDLWFATRDTGVFRYDGRSLQQLTTNDGLPDNEVACILVDSKDRIWISSMSAGLVQYNNGRVVKRYTAPGDIGNGEIWTVMEDREGNIWFCSEGYGVYRYDGDTLRNFGEQQGLGVRAVQSIYQDREGKLWLGGGGGLYRMDGDSMVHVKRNGPWR